MRLSQIQSEFYTFILKKVLFYTLKKRIGIFTNDGFHTCKSIIFYSRVWNKRIPLNKHSRWKIWQKKISVAPIIPYTYTTKIGCMEPGIRP